MMNPPDREKKFKELMGVARRRLNAMSKDEKEYGFAPPESCSSLEHARTALFAIEAALKTRDWGIAAEGYLMLKDALDRVGGVISAPASKAKKEH